MGFPILHTPLSILSTHTSLNPSCSIALNPSLLSKIKIGFVQEPFPDHCHQGLWP